MGDSGWFFFCESVCSLNGISVPQKRLSYDNLLKMYPSIYPHYCFTWRSVYSVTAPAVVLKYQDNPAHQKCSRSGVHLFSPQIKRVFDIEVQSSRRGGEISAGGLRSSAWFGDSLWHLGWSSPTRERERVLTRALIHQPPKASQTSRTVLTPAATSFLSDVEHLEESGYLTLWRMARLSGEAASHEELWQFCHFYRAGVCCFSRITTSRENQKHDFN